MCIIIGIDHGYYDIKMVHTCFPTGLVAYDYESYMLQNVLQYAGKEEFQGISVPQGTAPAFSV